MIGVRNYQSIAAFVDLLHMQKSPLIKTLKGQQEDAVGIQVFFYKFVWSAEFPPQQTLYAR